MNVSLQILIQMLQPAVAVRCRTPCCLSLWRCHCAHCKCSDWCSVQAFASAVELLPGSDPPAVQQSSGASMIPDFLNHRGSVSLLVANTGTDGEWCLPCMVMAVVVPVERSIEGQTDLCQPDCDRLNLVQKQKPTYLPYGWQLVFSHSKLCFVIASFLLASSVTVYACMLHGLQNGASLIYRP